MIEPDDVRARVPPGRGILATRKTRLAKAFISEEKKRTDQKHDNSHVFNISKVMSNTIVPQTL